MFLSVYSSCPSAVSEDGEMVTRGDALSTVLLDLNLCLRTKLDIGLSFSQDMWSVCFSSHQAPFLRWKALRWKLREFLES